MLSLTKKTGYGLIAMCHLAQLDQGQVASAREIAETFGVPQSLLMNVLKELAAAGYVQSVRGAHGGYRLGRSAEDISIADLITAVEGPIRLAECLAGDGAEGSSQDTCDLVDRCPIADPVHRIQRKLHDFLKQVSLADIVRPMAVSAGRAEDGG
jgi:Rrf2 family protein